MASCMMIEAYNLPEKLKEMIVQSNSKYLAQEHIPFFEAFNQLKLLVAELNTNYKKFEKSHEAEVSEL